MNEADLAITKRLILALDMLELGPNHPWRHVYLKMLDEGEAKIRRIVNE